jgi:hypothetical protein
MSLTTLRRTARHRLPILGLATALSLGGGAGLIALASVNGSAGADTTLGGLTVSALAEGVTAQYEQPNFPFPTTPSLEVDEGYADTTDNYGPTGTATASVFYPGQVIANSGPDLALLVPEVPLPPAPVWPIEAVSDFPQTPNSASTDEPGVNMDTTSSEDANTATAAIGDDAAEAGSPGSQSGTPPAGTTGNFLGSSSSLIGITEISGSSSSSGSGATAVGTATATDSGISILGGFITIGGVTTTASATSDGTTGSVSGSTVVANVNIAGTPVTIDANGIEADGKTEALAAPIPTLNTLLKELGISLAVTSPTDVVGGASAVRTLDGLRISINITELDAAANKFSSLLPSKLTSELPVAFPNGQVFTLDLGTVTVSSDASPAFVNEPGGGGTSVGIALPPDNDTAPSSAPSFTGGDDTGTGSFTPSTGGSGLPTSTPAPQTQSPSATSGAPAAAITPVFKGIGTGLILLGLALALGLAYAYKRADDLSDLAGPRCAEGDPLRDRFLDGEDGVDPAGDFRP